jgi:hybrid cluster-associated redox disulfide protein
MIDKDMTIGDVISRHPQTISVFKKFGLDCNECQIAALEDLEHGAGVHKVNLEELLEELNQVIERD